MSSTFSFSSIGHAFASIGKDIVIGAKAVEHAIAKIASSQPAVEAITSLIDPRAVVIERAAYHVLGAALQAALEVDGAASSNGLNLSLDVAAIAELRALGTSFKSDLATLGIKF